MIKFRNCDKGIAVSASEEFRRHYDDYYTGGEHEWRRLGAIDKADNIVRAWGTYSATLPARVVELAWIVHANAGPCR